MQNQKIVLSKRPSGLPSPDCFRLEEEAHSPRPQGLVRVRNEFISLDPYQRSVIGGNHMGQTANIGDVVPGEAVCTVIESENDEFPEGTVVRAHSGWQVFSDHMPQALSRVPSALSRPSLALSILGMPGLTAYAAMHQIAKVKAGDTVLIPAAIGGVGAMAGQLAKLAGATTIGITSSEEKCALAKELGYHHVLNRNSGALAEDLSAVAPQGISIYLDLAGDPILTIAAQQLSLGGHVILCGLIQDYNGNHKTVGPPPGLWIGKRATVSGLVVYDYEHLRSTFEAAYTGLYEQGVLKPSEHVFQGLESAPDAFCRMMQGQTLGKVVVEVGKNGASS
jgi:NADPH-dependent curcumin reductase CurA